MTNRISDPALVDMILERVLKARKHFEDSGEDFEVAKKTPFDEDEELDSIL